MSEPQPNEVLLEERARLAKRARRGGAVLAARSVLLQLTILVGGVWLARTLSPQVFGVFGVAQSAIAFFTIFGDGGLGVALIARKGDVSQRELSSVFWLQLALASTVASVFELVAPWVPIVWTGIAGHVPVARALTFTLVLTVLKVPPIILMERELHFTRIAVIELVGKVVYYVVALVLATRGFGVSSLVAAILCEGASTTGLAYLARPWRPSFVLDRETLRPIVRYGVAYQTRSLVSSANEMIAPLLATAALGAESFGLLQWAFRTATFPMEVVNIIGRVAFPLYSRLQGDRTGLTRAIQRSIQLCALATTLFAGLMWGLGHEVVSIVYGAQWVPAVPALHVYVSALTIGFLVPVIAHALDASGKPQVVTRLSFVWVGLNWIVVPLVLLRWKALVPFALGYSVHMIVGNLLVIWVVKREYPELGFLRALWPGFAGGAAVALAWAFLPKDWITGPLTLVAALAASVVGFVATALAADRTLLSEARALLVRPKPAA